MFGDKWLWAFGGLLSENLAKAWFSLVLFGGSWYVTDIQQLFLLPSRAFMVSSISLQQGASFTGPLGTTFSFTRWRRKQG
jgi:hypothetical protein